MIAIRRFLTVILAGMALCAPARAEDKLLAEADGVAPNIHQVVSGGYWSQGKREGFFRVIVISGGVEHVAHRLYLQWLEIDLDIQSYSVASTRGVKEINGGHGFLLDVKAEFPDMESGKISVAARSARPPQEKHFSITVKGDGSYTIKSR